MLHTLRQWINDDKKWREILRGLNDTFYHQTVTTEQIETYVAQKSGLDLKAFFDQYLRDVRIPTLEYKVENQVLKYRWSNTVNNFEMPVQIMVNEQAQWLYPKDSWSLVEIKALDIKIDPDFYVKSQKI